MESYQKLRLQEFNSFDLERILKENVETLSVENEGIMNFLESNQHLLPEEMVRSLSEEAGNNAAEIVRILSLTHHTENVYEFFAGGPLFRKDRDAK